MTSFLYRIFFLLNGLALATALSAQLSMESAGHWEEVVDHRNVLEAGLDFEGVIESEEDQVFLNIFLTDDDGNKNFKYRVDVHQADIDWHPNLFLYIRRTGNGRWKGNGQANGLVKDGTNFQLLNTTPIYFFNGKKNRYDVPIQFRVEGASVLLPAKTYSTTVIYTVTEL